MSESADFDSPPILDRFMALGQPLLPPNLDLHPIYYKKFSPYFKIPQVRICNTLKRNQNQELTALKYKINQKGFSGQGCTNQISHSLINKFQFTMIKLHPDEFNKETFDPKDLASPDGHFWIAGSDATNPRVGVLTGSVGQFDELDEDFDQITVGDYNQEFQLVYQGKTYEVDGLTCLKAEIECNGKKVISGPTDYIYNITSTNDRLLALTPLVSPFAEDDNCVRVIFLPCQSAGTIVQPGDVLGTLKIIKPDYFDIVRDELIYSSSILANLWLQENQAPKFLSKSKFQELIIDWRKNNEKWRTELKEKKEEERKEKEKTKEKNIAKIEIDKLKKVMKKEENIRKHELWLQDTQKKKMEKIENLKKRQAEQRRLKHERLERQKQAYEEDFHPVFGKPMVFGNATGFPDSKNPNSEEFVTTREGGYDESTRGGFGKYSDGIRYEESTRRGFEKSSSRGRYDESTRRGFEKSTRGGLKKSTTGGFEKSSRVWLDESTRGGFDISTRGGLASSTRGRSDNSISGGFKNLSSGVFDKSTEGCFDSDFGNNQNNKRTYPCTSGSSANLLGSKLAKVEQSDPRFNNPAGHDEKNSDFLYEEAQSMFQITVAGTSSLSAGAQRERGAFGRNIDMRGGQSSVGGGNHMGSGNDVRDIEMERLEVQLRKKKLMEDILNSQRELLKLEQAEENLLKKRLTISKCYLSSPPLLFLYI